MAPITQPLSAIPCVTYDPDAARRSLAACLAPLGGLERFVRPGMRVLLKPNLLAAALPQRAVTTHPVVAPCVAELLLSKTTRPCGARVGWL